MNKGETFVLLRRLLGHCDKALVRHIVQRYWLPAERNLSISLRQTARQQFFCNELLDDSTSRFWWYSMSCLGRSTNIFGYIAVHGWKSRHNYGLYLPRLAETHDKRMKLCQL